MSQFVIFDYQKNCKSMPQENIQRPKIVRSLPIAWDNKRPKMDAELKCSNPLPLLS